MVSPPDAVHTVAFGAVWANRQGARVLSRHPEREEAVTAGFEIARILGVEHVVHLEEPATAEPPEGLAPSS